MKVLRFFILSFVLLVIFGWTISANAVLIDNGDGTVTQIRSDGSILMWLKDANYAKTSGFDTDGYMTWNNAVAWANSLSYAGYYDWRLPDTLPINGSTYDYNYTYDGSTDVGYNITSLNSEMAYMHYVELGNEGQYGGALINTCPFCNLKANVYWSGTCTPDACNPWYFNFDHGFQSYDLTGASAYAWAVRNVVFANFSGTPTSGFSPLTVQFTDSSVGEFTSWLWDFGDGGSSTEKSPSHIYTSTGIYTVSLTVSGPDGTDTETKTNYITVNPSEAPDLVGKVKEFHTTHSSKNVGVNSRVKNDGNRNAGEFKVAMFLSSDGINQGELLCKRKLHSGLKKDHSVDVVLVYGSEVSLSGKYLIVVVDSKNEILEQDETNNTITIMVP